MIEDEELQSNIERGLAPNNTQGPERIYQVIFNALKKDPMSSLPVDFAEGVVKKIQAARDKKASRWDMVWLIFGGVSFIVAALVAAVITGFRPDPGVFTFFSNYSGLIIFGAILVVILQVLERQLISKQVRRSF